AGRLYWWPMEVTGIRGLSGGWRSARQTCGLWSAMFLFPNVFLFLGRCQMRRLCGLAALLSAAIFLIAARVPEAEWKPLFNGKDLTGWKHVGPGYMTVENGLIQTHGGMGLLYWTGGKVGH